MKEYKKLHLKNDDDSDRLIDHLNQGWELFREFTGWVIVCKFFDDVKSPLIARLEEILAKPSAGEMTIEQFEVLWNEAGGNLNASVSPAAEPEKPVFRPHAEWFGMLKEPLRSQALEAFVKYPRSLELSTSMMEAFYSAFGWEESGMFEKWNGVTRFFEGGKATFANSDFQDGYELAKQCAPDGWEQQGAGE